MPFNIEEFRAQQNRNNGHLRTNKFHVRIPIPLVLSGGEYNGQSTSRILEFYVQDASLPGYDLVKGNVRRWSYGPNEVRPYSGNVNEMTLTVNIDGNAETLEFFNRWINGIMPHDISRGIAGSYEHGAGPSNMFLMSYKEEYATSIFITSFDDAGEEKLEYELIEAFPTAISLVQLSWGDQNQIQQVGITIDYLDWTKSDANQTAGTA